MHDFYYRGQDLYCEKIPVQDIIKKVGTPVYIYSHKTLTEHVKKLKRAFQPARALICYSVKANSNLTVLKTVVEEGFGLDIVSGGELYRAKRAGCPAKKIVYAGVGKQEGEIEDAIRYGILFFNVESSAELQLINEVAARLKKKAHVSLRVNPGVDPQTHDYVATGKSDTKFGIDFDASKKILENRHRYKALRFVGLHVHIGSQILTGAPFVEAFWKVLHFINDLEKKGIPIRYLNLGGGLGAAYGKENPQTADEFAQSILPLFQGRNFKLVLEPGRFIAANAGIFVTRVLYIKETRKKNYAIIDGGMNDLIRPTLYGAYHDVWPLRKSLKEAQLLYDVVGPVCETGDFLARDRLLQELAQGDALAVMSAGAYGFVMASNYNSRPRAPEVFVQGDQFFVARKRETYTSLVAGEAVPRI